MNGVKYTLDFDEGRPDGATAAFVFSVDDRRVSSHKQRIEVATLNFQLSEVLPKVYPSISKVSRDMLHDEPLRYLLICQQMIVYLDMRKDGFPADKLKALKLFPELEQFIDRNSLDWPVYSALHSSTSDLRTIEEEVFAKIAANMETKYWYKTDVLGDAEFLRYDETMRDHGCNGPEKYVKAPDGSDTTIINTFGTHIDSGSTPAGEWHESVGDELKVTEMAMKYMGYSGCTLDFAKRVQGGKGKVKFIFKLMIENGDGCDTSPYCTLVDSDKDAYFSGNATKNVTIAKGATKKNEIRFGFAKSWGDRFQNTCFFIRDEIEKLPFRGGGGGIPDKGIKNRVMTTTDAVVATVQGIQEKPFVYTGFHKKTAATPKGKHYAITHYSPKPAMEIMKNLLNNTIKRIKANNEAFIKRLNAFPDDEKFCVASKPKLSPSIK